MIQCEIKLSSSLIKISPVKNLFKIHTNSKLVMAEGPASTTSGVKSVLQGFGGNICRVKGKWHCLETERQYDLAKQQQLGVPEHPNPEKFWLSINLVEVRVRPKLNSFQHSTFQQ